MSVPVSSASRIRGSLPWAFVAGLVLVSLNLRACFVAVAPISTRLRADLHVGGAAIGLLTSLPVLCFGLLAPVALLVIRRLGAELAVVFCLGGVVVGALVRSVGPFSLAVLGTLVIGMGITVGNVVVPALIRRDGPPGAAGALTGIYASAMNVGSVLVSLGTAPLEQAAGWRVALGVWSLMALLGLAGWLGYLRVRDRRRASAAEASTARVTHAPGPSAVPDRPSAAPPGPAATITAATGAERSQPIFVRPLAWLLALAFAAQATSYYSLTAWLPTVLSDEIGLGASAAGAASSVFQVCAIIGALGVPVVALRWPNWAAIGLVGVLWMAFPLQLLVAPHAYLLGSVLGGTAQGGGFAALFTVVVQASSSARESARLSAFIQGVGYVVAALGPTVLGRAHDVTGGWTVPVLVVAVATVSFTVSGVLAGLSQAREPQPGGV